MSATVIGDNFSVMHPSEEEEAIRDDRPKDVAVESREKAAVMPDWPAQHHQPPASLRPTPSSLHRRNEISRKRGEAGSRSSTPTVGLLTTSTTVVYYFRLQLMLAAIDAFAIALTAGTCNVDQQYTCGRAVAENRLSYLSGGGECIRKQYAQFTHLCSVHNYLPTVDFCCCSLDDSVESDRLHWRRRRRRRTGQQLLQHRQHGDVSDEGAGLEVPETLQSDTDGDETDADGDEENTTDTDDDERDAVRPRQPRGAMCCRYHQDWNHFRCLEVDDAVPIAELTNETYGGESFLDFPLGVFLPAVLSTLTIAVCCIACCTRCCWCSSNEQRQSLLRPPATYRMQTTIGDHRRGNTDSSTINGNGHCPRSNYFTSTSSQSDMTSSSCVKPPLSPPCYTPHVPNADVTNGTPIDCYPRSNYAVVCRYAAPRSSPFPAIALPAAGGTSESGYLVDPSVASMVMAGRIIIPSAPGPEYDDGEQDTITAMVTGGGDDVIGRHYAAVMPWPPVGPCCTHIVHPPPVYTRYATSPNVTDGGVMTPFPPPVVTSPQSTSGPDFV